MERQSWTDQITNAWKEKSVVWLMGVRRAGKTTLCKKITPNQIYDCELPRIRKLFDDPEQFYNSLQEQKVTKITIDEIHRLENPSEVLKIAADYFPNIKVLATGSSTLAVKKKFKDTLTDRKRIVFLTPLNFDDIKDYSLNTIIHRMKRGGLPPFYLANQFPESSFAEWLDSYWAKDIEELFNIENKYAFLKFFELLALQSGGLYEAKNFTSPCGVSHTTIANYLNALSQTNTAYIIRPFHKKAAKEIISAPKVYFFDTGFMTYFRGKDEIHDSDIGFYWEHIVLNELLGFVDREQIHIWRDKSKNEVDFIIKKRGKHPIAIECKWDYKEFKVNNLKKFRDLHPHGKNVLISHNILSKSERSIQDISVMYTSIKNLKKVILDILI